MAGGLSGAQTSGSRRIRAADRGQDGGLFAGAAFVAASQTGPRKQEGRADRPDQAALGDLQRRPRRRRRRRARSPRCTVTPPRRSASP